MKKILSTIFVLVAFAVTSQAANWKLDAVHSSVEFSVRHLVVSKTKGGFDKFEAAAQFDAKDLSTGSVEFTIQIASIDTDNEDRDKHLKSADFFDAEKFPTMTFKSTKVHGVDGNGFMLTGNLTLKDVTKEVTFECEFNGEGGDPWGNTRAGFSIEGKINRKDFNMTWSKALETGGLVVGEEVSIELETEWVMEK